MSLSSAEADPDTTVAVHEAGHAVVAHRLGERVIAMVITASYGQTGIRPLTVGARRRRLERVATVFFAGDIALAIHRGLPALAFSSAGDLLGDQARAIAVIRRIRGITEAGVTELLPRLMERAADVLRAGENWALVRRLADELLTKRRLTSGEVAAIVPVSAE
jgi:hypothetical protein